MRHFNRGPARCDEDGTEQSNLAGAFIHPPQNEKLPTGCLDAFLAAPEEDPVSFASAFSALQPQERMKVLLGLTSDAPDATDIESRGHGRVVELLDALDRASLARREEEAVTTRLARAGAAESAADDGLEVVDLASLGDVHHGGMANLFTDIPLQSLSAGEGSTCDGTDAGQQQRVLGEPRRTAFDNFFDTKGEDSDEMDEHRQRRIAASALSRPERDWAAAASPPALDDFLSFDDEPVTATRRGEGADASTELLAAVQHHDPHSNPDCEGDETDSVGSADLPGLEYGAGTAGGGCSPTAGLGRDPAVALELRSIIRDEDSCVHAFALDPGFDYDSDLLGPAFRQQEAHRQSGKAKAEDLQS